MKTCSKCGKEKHLFEFFKHVPSKDGHRPDCKVCNGEVSRKYRKTDAYKINKRASSKARYRRMSPEEREKYYEGQSRCFAKTPRHALTLSRFNALRRKPTENPISIDQLYKLWEAQDGKCALSGITMTWCQGKIMPRSISLDRIDNSKGYVHGNIRLVCYVINAFRNTMSDNEMLSIARTMIAKADYQLTQEAA